MPNFSHDSGVDQRLGSGDMEQKTELRQTAQVTPGRTVHSISTAYFSIVLWVLMAESGCKKATLLACQDAGLDLDGIIQLPTGLDQHL